MTRAVAKDEAQDWVPDAPPWANQPVSPAAFGALLLLLVASPLMRGGNRQVALVLLEATALAFLAFVAASARGYPKLSLRACILSFVLLCPAWLTVIYLLPLIPADAWNAMAGRSIYAEVLAKTGIAQDRWLPLSIVPDATLISLLSGSLLVAAFVGGYLASSTQLRTAILVFVSVAFTQVAFGLLQASGGQASSLYFGGIGGRPFGTFANPNHFANYLGMALVAYILLGWHALGKARESRNLPGKSSRTGLLLLLGAGAVFLLVGILMSRSRAGALTALASAVTALVLVLGLGSRSRRKSWRSATVLAGIAILAGIALVGADFLLVRFDLERLERDIPLRGIQATTTLEGAALFWPWGAGWGTYYSVYPRFQPANLVGIADYAHHDYAQMLFEGGIFAVVIMLAVGYLLVARGLELGRAALQNRKLTREEMTSAICGIALLGFLLHSFREFNMHIPANAIIACLLAGAYLRPLPTDPRPGRMDPASP